MVKKWSMYIPFMNWMTQLYGYLPLAKVSWKLFWIKNGITPTVKSATRIILDGGRLASNYFFTSFQENDSILWFGNRGYGAHRLNLETGKFTPYKFDNIVNSQMTNDIFAIYKNENGYWFATSSGLLHFNQEDSQHHNKVELLSKNTAHGILEDQQNNIWISTNQGLVRFNPKTHTSQTYDRKKTDWKLPSSAMGPSIKTYQLKLYFLAGQTDLLLSSPMITIWQLTCLK